MKDWVLMNEMKGRDIMNEKECFVYIVALTLTSTLLRVASKK